MATPQRPAKDWAELCSKTKATLPSKVGSEAWIVFIASAFITSPDPTLLAAFSQYLTTHDPDFSTPTATQRLSVRFRDVCLKLLTLVGAPKMLSSLMPLAKSEGDVEAKAEASKLNAKWKNVDVQAIHDRGVETIHSIYDHVFLPKIFASWGDHKADVTFNELFAVYGLYLSDFEHLTAVETEAVVYASITCQGLRGPGLWHMRGMGRVLGARNALDIESDTANIRDMLEAIRTTLKNIVEWVGPDFARLAKIDEWAQVHDVDKDIGGWGED